MEKDEYQKLSKWWLSKYEEYELQRDRNSWSDNSFATYSKKEGVIAIAESKASAVGGVSRDGVGVIGCSFSCDYTPHPEDMNSRETSGVYGYNRAGTGILGEGVVGVCAYGTYIGVNVKAGGAETKAKVVGVQIKSQGTALLAQGDLYSAIFDDGPVGVGVFRPGEGKTDGRDKVRLDVADRLRLRQGKTYGAGIWFYQENTNKDEALVGMARDNQVGFWGQKVNAWGLVMDTSTGNVGIGHQDPGANASNGNIRLDVMDRVRIRQGGTGSAGIWLHQKNTNKDEAFVGMKSDHEVGFWGVAGAGWACWMDTVSGHWHSNNVCVAGGDCAEKFEAATQADPGTVMVLNSAGQLEQSTRSYDKRVAGVVSGAGDLKPGVMLSSQLDAADTLPIALCGKVFCKVEADSNPIEVGDLLTTSNVPGHAMKAADQSRAFGAILGKATQPLASGRGLVPVLVTLT